MFTTTRKDMAMAGLTLLVAVYLPAQYKGVFGTTWNNPISSFLSTSVYWKSMTRVTKQSVPAQPAPAGHAPSVTYTPTSAPLMPAPMAKAFSKEKELQKELEDAFSQFLTLFDTQLVTGPDRHNVATAAAFFIAIDYGVATGKEVSNAHIEALRDALQQGLLRHQKFQSMGSRQRQELSEAFVICALLARYGYQQGLEQSDSQQMERYRDFARLSLKEVLGSEPEQMTFTSTGLIFKD